MPNRIIKESICTSDTIDRLSPEEEIFFYRLIVNCDDYGRMDARPQILRAKCFPLRLDQVDDCKVIDWLYKLEEVGLVQIYEVDSRKYIQIVTWNDHQQIRAKKSKYPAPDDSLKSSDIRCNQIKSNVPVIQSNPIQSESEYESNPIPEDDDWKKISTAYTNLTGRLESPLDVQEMKEVLKLADTDQIIQLMQDIHKRFKPKYNGDKIKSFSYFRTAIEGELKGGGSGGTSRTSTTGKVKRADPASKPDYSEYDNI